MTMPDSSTVLTDGSPTGAVILLELGKLSTQAAVLNTKMDSLISAKDDHENRLREIRSDVPHDLADRLAAVESQQQQTRGAVDLKARIGAWAAAAAAAGAGLAGYLHH